MSIVLIGVKTLVGGLAVVAFALIGEAGRPKRFAGLLASAPSVAVASLGVTAMGGGEATLYARGMLIGSAGMVAYCLVSFSLIERLHALAGSILSWAVWLLVAGGLYLLVGR